MTYYNLHQIHWIESSEIIATSIRTVIAMLISSIHNKINKFRLRFFITNNNSKVTTLNFHLFEINRYSSSAGIQTHFLLIDRKFFSLSQLEIGCINLITEKKTFSWNLLFICI